MAAETSQTLSRGLHVLQVVGRAPAGLTMTEIAAETGANRTVVHRLVATLLERSLLRRNAAGRFQLGFALLDLAAQVTPGLREAAQPLLREVADATGATAHLTIADGEHALAVAVVEPSWTDFHVGYRLGAKHPLDKGAAGRAVLAAQAGRDEVVLSRGELQVGASGLAVPVLGVAGLAACVGVVTLGQLDEVRVGPVVRSAARRLATELGSVRS